MLSNTMPKVARLASRGIIRKITTILCLAQIFDGV